MANESNKELTSVWTPANIVTCVRIVFIPVFMICLLYTSDAADEEVKLERAQEAMDLAESLGFAATAAPVGERAQVIVDGIEETEDGAELIGHAWFQAPDSDGAVHLDASEASVGDILTVEFTDSFCYELIGHVVE